MTDEDPFEELADLEEIAREDGDGADLDADVENLFTEVEVDEIDEEELWNDVAASGDVTTSAGAEAGVSGGGVVEDDGTGDVVPKASYCQKCEYFSEPPEVACQNHGTEIVQQVDLDHFRVRDCPVVERRQSASRNIEDQ
jgi:hypothetical protein